MQQHPQQQQNMKEPKSEKTIFFENALYIEIHFKIKSRTKKYYIGLFLYAFYFHIPPFRLSQTRHLKVTALFIPPNCDIDTGWISF